MQVLRVNLPNDTFSSHGTSTSTAGHLQQRQHTAYAHAHLPNQPITTPGAQGKVSDNSLVSSHILPHPTSQVENPQHDAVHACGELCSSATCVSALSARSDRTVTLLACARTASKVPRLIRNHYSDTCVQSSLWCSVREEFMQGSSTYSTRPPIG